MANFSWNLPIYFGCLFLCVLYVMGEYNDVIIMFKYYFDNKKYSAVIFILYYLNNKIIIFPQELFQEMKVTVFIFKKMELPEMIHFWHIKVRFQN